MKDIHDPSRQQVAAVQEGYLLPERRLATGEVEGDRVPYQEVVVAAAAAADRAW